MPARDAPGDFPALALPQAADPLGHLAEVGGFRLADEIGAVQNLQQFSDAPPHDAHREEQQADPRGNPGERWDREDRDARRERQHPPGHAHEDAPDRMRRHDQDAFSHRDKQQHGDKFKRMQHLGARIPLTHNTLPQHVCPAIR